MKNTIFENKMFDSIQTVVAKNIPKTPHHFRYHSCNNLMEYNKTKERQQNRSKNGILKEIF